ncbi:hypothetical protein FGB62_1g552 [Gracilaria domingensis]|nr:hypothetical protein FGB62_1g552 [Gracilaria domingensis]
METRNMGNRAFYKSDDVSLDVKRSKVMCDRRRRARCAAAADASGRRAARRAQAESKARRPSLLQQLVRATRAGATARVAEPKTLPYTTLWTRNGGRKRGGEGEQRQLWARGEKIHAVSRAAVERLDFEPLRAARIPLPAAHVARRLKKAAAATRGGARCTACRVASFHARATATTSCRAVVSCACRPYRARVAPRLYLAPPPPPARAPSSSPAAARRRRRHAACAGPLHAGVRRARHPIAALSAHASRAHAPHRRALGALAGRQPLGHQPHPDCPHRPVLHPAHRERRAALPAAHAHAQDTRRVAPAGAAVPAGAVRALLLSLHRVARVLPPVLEAQHGRGRGVLHAVGVAAARRVGARFAQDGPEE